VPDTAPSLVVGVTTRALFDLEFENEIFQTEGLGLVAFRAYQREHEKDPIAPGTAFPLVRDLLALNERSTTGTVVEVILLSRNDPDSAMRVFRTIEDLHLPITRGAFRGGRDPWPFVETYGCHLLLSADPDDVRGALRRGTPAALVSRPPSDPIEGDTEVRIAFDADSVLFDGASDKLWDEGHEAYFRHERENAEVPLQAGPFEPFLRALAAAQRRFPEEGSPIRTAVVTARTAPAHMRVLNTFRAWDVRVDEFVMVGSIAKVEALKHIRPHLFVDDRGEHVERAAMTVPSAQVLSITVEETEQVELFEEAAIAKAASTRPTRRRSRTTKKSLKVTTLLSTLAPTSEAPIEGNQVEGDAALRDRALPPDAAPVDPAASARRRSAQK
jgi:5'-nucleotidase